MTTGGIYVFDTDNISKKAVRVIPEVKNDENTKTAGCWSINTKEYGP